MAGLNLQPIREALATQIRNNVVRSPSVFAYDPESRSGHNIVIKPASSYVAYFGTMGPNGLSDILLDIDIEVPGRLADSQIAMDDYLSAGTGNGSSVVDAIHVRDASGNRSLGGLVDDCVCLTADGPNLDADPLTARLHVQIMVHKVNAEV